MPSRPPTIQVDAVSYRYPNGVEALRNVSLEVGRGEIVSLVGPSGCGKSTLLNIVSGLLTQTSGHVLVDGEALADRLGRFAFMPQKDSLLPWRTAEGNAALLLEAGGTNRRESLARATSMLESFGLGAFAATRPDQLSGGMRQRVALVRTVLPGRDVLLDEPFGALDAITRSELHGWLMDLQAKTGLAMLLVTHDVEEAMFLSEKVFVMSPRPGRVVAVHDIPFERPRPPELVGWAEFAALRAKILSGLRQALSLSSAAWTCP